MLIRKLTIAVDDHGCPLNQILNDCWLRNHHPEQLSSHFIKEVSFCLRCFQFVGLPLCAVSSIKDNSNTVIKTIGMLHCIRKIFHGIKCS